FLWNLVEHLLGLMIFAILYGICAGGFSAIWTGMMKNVRTEYSDVGVSTGRGIGAASSEPVSEAILSGHDLNARTGVGFHGEYDENASIIVLTGVTAFCGLIWFGGRWKRGGC
ncbi:hypothetical protein BJ878DRAFT_416476, partial [Calycina marina]